MALPNPGGDRAGLRTIRNRWKEIDRADHATTLRVAVLASYTADPIVPYLGAPLPEVGLHPAFHIGPYNQIVQECLAPEGQTAAFDPDVVVVAQRLEELPSADWTSGLLDVTDAALAAAERWHATLVAVLPGLPEADPHGVGGDGHADGWAAAAAAARERMRTALSGRPNAHAVDLEAVLRSVGAARAYHPALFRHAKIPYREEVFHLLGTRIARVLGLRFGDRCRAAAVDLHGLADDPEATDGLGPVLRWLRAAGARVHVMGGTDGVSLWRDLTLADASVPDLVDDWIFDDRDPGEQFGELLERAGLADDEFAVLRRKDESLMVHRASRSPLDLGTDVEHWPARIAATALFDRLPVTLVREETTAPDGATPSKPGGGLSLEDFVAGLGTEVDFRTADTGDLDKIADMLLRTKDFTLGTPFTRDDAAAFHHDDARRILVGSVRDRFGDLGTSVAIALERDGDDCAVRAFLVSCPAMGKGVEEISMRRITDEARSLGGSRILLPFQHTGRNQVAADFLRSLPGGSPDDDGSHLVAVPAATVSTSPDLG
ncbi:MAG: hypothetical protein ACRDP6_37560 [Actinoallomurus sp.]